MTPRKRIYLAGPMTGLPMFNQPAFYIAADELREAGWEVINPADNYGGRTDLPRSSYLLVDIALLLQCEALALLPGWQHSVGARLEYLLARELCLPILDAQTLKPLDTLPEASVRLDSQPGEVPEHCSRESILDEAKRITAGARNSDYGHPADDFGRTARLWTGILKAKLREGAEIAATDVPLCMIAVKLARQAHRHKRDNLVDIAGYARTAAMTVGDE